MVKILHAADFHLDSAFVALSEEQARRRRQESRQSVERMVDYANDHGAQLMLLAGDLFDGDNVYSQTGEMLCAALGRFSGQVVIAPGNHDSFQVKSAYARIALPENVHVLTDAVQESIAFPQYGCTVYGAAFTGEEASAFEGFSVTGDDIAIGVLHGEVGAKDSKYRPIPVENIAKSGLDYLALGHVHQFSGIQTAGKTAWAYPGCPEGRGFDELGDKGFLFGEVDKGSVKLRFVPFAKRRYEWLEVDATDAAPLDAVLRKLPLQTEDDIYRIVLTGEVSEGVNVSALQEELAPRFYALEIRDKTRAAQDIWEKRDEDTLRGLFLRNLYGQYDAAETEEERTRIEQAVRFGLAAMDNREI